MDDKLLVHPEVADAYPEAIVVADLEGKAEPGTVPRLPIGKWVRRRLHWGSQEENLQLGEPWIVPEHDASGSERLGTDEEAEAQPQTPLLAQDIDDETEDRIGRDLSFDDIDNPWVRAADETVSPDGPEEVGGGKNGNDNNDDTTRSNEGNNEEEGVIGRTLSERMSNIFRSGDIRLRRFMSERGSTRRRRMIGAAIGAVGLYGAYKAGLGSEVGIDGNYVGNIIDGGDTGISSADETGITQHSGMGPDQDGASEYKIMKAKVGQSMPQVLHQNGFEGLTALELTNEMQPDESGDFCRTINENMLVDVDDGIKGQILISDDLAEQVDEFTDEYNKNSVQAHAAEAVLVGAAGAATGVVITELLGHREESEAEPEPIDNSPERDESNLTPVPDHLADVSLGQQTEPQSTTSEEERERLAQLESDNHNLSFQVGMYQEQLAVLHGLLNPDQIELFEDYLKKERQKEEEEDDDDSKPARLS